MWIMTTNGFISAVQHRANPNYLMVRARKKEHLLQINPEAAIEQITPSDYPWRTTLTKAEFKVALIAQIDQIDYDNFKNAVSDNHYHKFLERVWFEGFGYGNLEQRRSNMKQGLANNVIQGYRADTFIIDDLEVEDE